MMPLSEGPWLALLNYPDQNPQKTPQRAWRFSLASFRGLPTLAADPP